MMLQTVATSPRAFRFSIERHRIKAAEVKVLRTATTAQQAQAERRVLCMTAITAGGQTIVAEPRIAALHQRRYRQYGGGVRRSTGAGAMQRNAATAAQ